MKSFDYWNNLGLIGALVIGVGLSAATGIYWLMLVSVALQLLFVGGVYIGKWHTTRPWEK